MANDPRSLFDQSRAAAQKGDFAKAMAIADQVVEQTRQSPNARAWAGELRFQLAREFLRTGRDFEAMELLQTGVELAPNSPCLFLLAHLERTFGNPQKAIDQAERGLALGQADAMDHTIAAKALMELGRDDEANGHWLSATELALANPDEIDLIRARFLRELGRFNLATASLEDLVAYHPEIPKALALLAESKPAVESDLPRIRKMETLADRKTTSPEDKKSLEFAIGKALDDLGRYESAMTHFNRANAIGYQSIAARGGFHRAGYAGSIELRKELFGKERLDRAGVTGHQSETPIFVVGMIRSGTTLLEQILVRHPEIGGAGEQKFWLALESRLIDFSNRRLNAGVLTEAAGTYLRLLERFRGDAKRVVDKQPGNLLLVGALHLAFPNARIIYLRRNSLDNAVSIWNTNIQTSVPFVHDKGNLAFAIRQHEELSDHWEEVMPSDRFMKLSYEELVLDREASTRRVLEFCGVAWDDACMTPEKGTGRVITPSLWQVRQPVYRTSIDRWKHYEPWLGELGALA